jgi:hypothetical protein
MPRAVTVGVLFLLLALSRSNAAASADRVVWAWERPETLDSLPADTGIAAVVGFVRLRGGAIIEARGRRFPLVVAPGRPPPIAVIHIEIDQSVPLAWTDALRAQVVAAAMSFAAGYQVVQIDMEIRQSQRAALLDVLAGVRAGVHLQTHLSMTALASWCETENWLAAAPVDEIVPMLFRMGRDGASLRRKLAAGGDFNDRRCRGAVGISLDAPVTVPSDRRVYIFNPLPWDAASLASAQLR